MGRKVPIWDSSYPKFNIDDLKGPRDLTKLYNKTLEDYTSKEDSPSKKLEELFKHYGWGFKYSLAQHEDRAVFRHLVKIIYYMRDDLKPSQEDFEKCNSDAGPGLLRPECSALPFSLDHPPPAKNEPREYLRKAVFHFPYQSLERCPSAFPILPNATENHRIQHTEREAMGDRSHGQGAAEDENLDNILDCAIAAAYLLDAGCTKADRTTLNWHSTLTDQAKWFLELIWLDWGSDSDYHTFKRTKLSPEARFGQVVTLKRNITEMLGQNEIYEGKYKHRLVWGIWEGCTSSFHQFLVRYSQNILHERGIEIPWSTGCIPLKGVSTDATENTIQAQTAYFFKTSYETKCYCELSGLEKAPDSMHWIERRFHELPLRLTFVTDPTSPPTSHTATEVTIEYNDWKCELRRAKYRWLGGIYPIMSGNSFQYVLFWSDHKRHEKGDKGKLRKYAPQECDRRITGGIEFKKSERSERVPLSEWQNGQPALLFYEKVLVPEEGNLKGVLQAAKHAVSSCQDSVIKDPKVQYPPGSSSQTVGVPAASPQQGVKHSIGYPKAAISSQPTNPQINPPPKQPGPTRRGPPEGSRAQPAKTTGARQYGGEALQYPGYSGQLRQGIQAGPEPLSHVSAHYLSGYQRLPPRQGQIDRPSMPRAQMPPPPGYFGEAANIGQEFGRSSENLQFASPLKPLSPEYMPDSSRVSTSQALEHGDVLEALFPGIPSEPIDPHGLGFSIDDPPTSHFYTDYLKPMSALPGHAQPSPEHVGGQPTFSSHQASTIPPLPYGGDTPCPFPPENYFADGRLPSLQQVQGVEDLDPFQALFDMFSGEAPLPQGPGTHREPAKRKEPLEYEAEESGPPGKKQRKRKGQKRE
ncbi:hypothetical protein EMPG_13113 [Blastomyces silverae]|uniref:Uncharacterized protein n=1 Tax=Blastomyces silverae TaxID=2060906 RepID=A0A0H1BR80_9EURO|nr:hypothetical protein EMPG_13113 [Blastomyces silverae]